jgi:hypothetical protein
MPGPVAIETDNGLLGPAIDACFTCRPPFQHKREWISDPKITGHGNTDPKTANPKRSRGRTLVLCFDGTGDSFDEDVSQFFSPSHPVSRQELITCGIRRTPTSYSS